MGEDWRALGAEAARKLREGRFAEAADGFRRVVELHPDHGESWFNLGYALRHCRQYQAALDAYGQALARNIRGPEESHLNRSVILSEHLHRVDQAIAELDEAIRLNPKLVSAWLNLGNLYEDLGKPADARKAYEGALRASPGNGRARARLAGIEVFQGEPKRAVAMLRDAVRKVSPGTEDAAEICFAMGNALDATGDYPAAFAAVAEGNAISGALRDPSRRYDRLAQERLVDALVAAFPEPRASEDNEPTGIAFICGMFRSGSTLVEQLLSRHPQVTAGGELEFIPAMVGEELQPYPQAIANASPARITELRGKYLAQLRALFPSASLVTDKRPDNFLHIGLIKTLFPAARIIHTVRDPLDNILSAYFLYFGDSITYSDRLDDLTHYYGQYRRLMDHWQRLYGADIFTVDYDTLVADPRAVLEPLLAFLGLAWDDKCIDHRTAKDAVRTASNWQVRKPLHGKSSGRWRNYAGELAPVREALERAGLLDLG